MKYRLSSAESAKFPCDLCGKPATNAYVMRSGFVRYNCNRCVS